MKREYEVYYSGKAFKAKGIYNIVDRTLKVFKGSTIVENEVDSFRTDRAPRARERDELIENGTIVDYKFVEDHVFEIPYHASALISTHATAGNKAWKTESGETIEDLHRGRKNLMEFREYYETYEIEEALEVEIEDLRADFKKKFPLEELPNLKIEEYDKRGSKDTFIYI